MDECKIAGKVIQVMLLREGVARNGNPWASQSFVLETQGQYQKKVYLEIFGKERINECAVKEGEFITASFDPESREWEGRWYTSLRVWKVERAGGQAAQPAPAQQPSQAAAPMQGMPQMPQMPTMPQMPLFDQMMQDSAADFGDGGDLPF